MTIADTWNPEQYARFQRERDQPFIDLLEMVRPMPDMRVVDLGCGSGRLTRLLHAHLHAKETLGIDQSPRMVAAAERDPRPSGLRFQLGTIDAFSVNGEYDLVASNSALQWVPNHEDLIPRLARALKPGGQLVFQVPAMHMHLSHTVAADIAAAEPFSSALGGWQLQMSVLEPDQYATLLDKCGFNHPHVRLVVYPHVLGGPEQVVDWMKGTLLTAYEARMPADLFGDFVREYQARLVPLLDRERPFFFPFKRILCWGRSAF
jgi:trans-aconitate 2-methyltransferase